MSCYLDAWRNYATFSGRARRKDYWMFVLFNVIFSLVAVAIDIATSGGEDQVVYGLYSLAVFIPSVAVTVRRLHDVGKSGWWILIGIVPFIGGFVLLGFMLSDSEPGENQYGPNPKGVPAEMAAFANERRGADDGTTATPAATEIEDLKARIAKLEGEIDRREE